MKTRISGFIFFLSIITLIFSLASCNGGNDADNASVDVNVAPAWNPAPSDIVIPAGESYNRVNGVALDANLPSQRMICATASDTCSFNVSVGGIGAGEVNCIIQFAPVIIREECQVEMVVADEAGGFISHTLNINIEQEISVSCAPNPVNEGQQINCGVVTTGGTPQVDAANDTCGGILAGGVYAYTPSEVEGPGTCYAAVELIQNTTIKDSEFVAVNEVNEAPVITSSAPTAATEDLLYTYNATATDFDLPANSLTWLLSAGDSCGGSIDPTTGVYAFTPAGPIPPATCDISVQVCDNGDPVLCDAELATINITAVNDPPVVSSTPPSATENTAYGYGIVCADPDADAVTLALSAGDSCGGAVTDNGDGTGMYSGWTPGEFQGGTTCVVGITCSDGQIPVDQNTTINIIEDNQPPVWNPAVSEIWVFTNEVHNANYGHAVDSDDPQNTLTCSNAAQTCSFPITISGSGTAAVDCNFSFTAPAAPETCSVTVQVSDGAGGVISQVVAVHVAAGPCILRVDAAASGTGNDIGFSWANAFPAIQAAVNRAYSGCEVWVKEGTYATGDINPVLSMKNGVEILGGFVGDENTLADRPAPDLLTQSVMDGEYRGKHVVVGASDALLDSFVVKGSGYFYPHMSQPQEGGGMFNSGVSDLEIYNCIFDYNSAGRIGGGIYTVNSSDLYISDSIFSRNRSTSGGGVVNRYSSNINFYNCSFSNNFSQFSGGGIISMDASTQIYDSIFVGNDGYRGFGGAIDSGFATLLVDNCEFTDNFGCQGGGAINTLLDNFTISNSYFASNRATYLSWSGYDTYRGYGGIIYSDRSTGVIRDSILRDGFAFVGGGILSWQSTILLDNDLIVENISSLGGGILLEYLSNMTIKNSTIADNIAFPLGADGLGGGIYSLASSLTMENSIVWNNYAAANFDWFVGYRVGHDEDKPVIIYSDVTLNLPPDTGNIHVNPYFIGPVFYDITTALGLAANSFEVADASIYTVGDRLRIGNYLHPFNVTAASGTTVTIDENFTPNIPAGAVIEYWGGTDYFVYDYYLSQTASGQAVTSPAVNVGNPATAVFGTTRTDSAADTGRIDMGFHYPVP